MSALPEIRADQVRDMLAYLSPDGGRDEWFKTLCAIHDGLGPDGFDVAQEWSERGASFSAINFRHTWRSIKSGGRVTIATLVERAKAAGWRPSADAPLPDAAALEKARREREARQAREEQEKAQRQALAAERARSMWARAEMCLGDHPYLVRKMLVPHQVRELNDELLVDVRDQAGQLVNVQRIASDGDKRFLAGGRIKGCHHLIRGQGTDRLVVCEGWATGAAINEATGLPVVVAFNAGNLEAVALYVRHQYPGAELVVAADDDWKRPENPGVAKARAAAALVGGLVAIPRFGRERLEDATDFNDMSLECGPDAVRAVFTEAFERAPSESPLHLPVPEVADVPAIDVWALPRPELKGSDPAPWLTRLQACSEATEAAAMAWAIGLALTPRVPVTMALGDVLAMLTRHWPEGVEPGALRAVHASLERLLEARRARALAFVSLPDDVARLHDLEAHQALPVLGEADYQGVVLLNAPMGSGKTLHVGRPYARWASAEDRGGRFVATCHRQSLVAELARVLQVDHYNDVLAEMSWAVRGFATCLPSIVKDAHAQIVDEADYLFLDEIDQVLRSIASKVTVADKKTAADVYRCLVDLVKRAKCIIGADATMSTLPLDFLEQCRPGERFRVVRVAPVGQGLSVSMAYGLQALATGYGEAMARLQQGQKLWIACGEKTRAIECGALLETMGARVLVLHSGNRDNTAQAAFWRDPEGQSLQYDAVVHTGVISSGMSITHRDMGQHFDHGMLIASGATITPADAMQMLRRVRYLKTWTVVCTPSHARDIDSAEAILAGIRGAAATEGHQVNLTDFDAFVARVKADDARARADFASGLWWALQAHGFKVERLALVDDAEMLARIKTLRANLRDQALQSILQADDLSDEEAARLRDSTTCTDETTAALLKHRIKVDLGVTAVDAEAVEAWDDGRGPRRMDRWSAAVLGLAESRAEDGEMVLRRFSKARALAYRWLFDGVDLKPGLRIDEALARLLVGRVIERRYLLAYLGIVPAKWARYLAADKAYPAPKYPVREMGEILERMGLSLRRREGTARVVDVPPSSPVYPQMGGNLLNGNTASEGKQTRNYWHEITADSWCEVQRWAELRNTRRLVTELVTDPLDDLPADLVELDAEPVGLDEPPPDWPPGWMEEIEADCLGHGLIHEPTHDPVWEGAPC